MSETLAKSAGLVSSGPRAYLTRRGFFLLLAAVPAYAQDAPHNEIHFDMVAGVPIIPGVVNGHKARLLVDTGTSPSVFTATLIRDSQSDTFIHATTPGERYSQAERNGSRASIRRFNERRSGGERKTIGRFAGRASCGRTG